MDDNEPPSLDSPDISPGSGHSRSLQLICTFDNKQENMRRLVCFIKRPSIGLHVTVSDVALNNVRRGIKQIL